MSEPSGDTGGKTSDEAVVAVEVQRDIDIAVSFAGENRSFVEEVVRKVQENAPDVTVFYDEDYKYESWGKDGIEYFTDVYMQRSRYVAMFISRSYAEKEWPRTEKRAALARALTERGEYVLPIRMDNTELPGIPHTVIYVEAIREGIEGLASGILHKLGSDRVKPAVPYHGKVAQTKDELRELISQRTPVWEYVLYASVLYQGRKDLGPLIRDHALGYAPSNEKRVSYFDEANQVVYDMYNDLLRFVDDFNRLLSDDAQIAAFGAPGEPGDPDLIIHLGERFMSTYKQLLDVAADLRGIRVSRDFAQLLQLAASVVTRPLADLDRYINTFVSMINEMHEKIVHGEVPNPVQLVVEVGLDDAALDALRQERERLERELGVT
jgi:hypothetical protein